VRLGQPWRKRICARYGILGVLVMGGEAYISFKPGLVDSNGRITDENTRQFLQAFVDRFAALLARLCFA
jgi:chromate reductase, NAD(P)H dehydrogenase (quinone)